MDEHTLTLELLAACEEGDFELVENLLLTGSNVDCEGDEGITPLQIACANGHEDVIHCLLSFNADINKFNSYGWTPLMHAARNGHIKIVQLLLNHGADENLHNNFKHSACDLAAASGHLDTFKLLHQVPKSEKVSQVAAVYGHEKILESMNKCENDVFESGITPLMLGIAAGHKNVVDLLFQKGWNVNTINSNNYTALDIPTLQGNKEMDSFVKSSVKKYNVYTGKRTSSVNCSTLLPLGKGVKYIDTKRSSLMASCLIGNFEMVRWWIEKGGANVNQQDLTTGWTPLMNASAHGQKDIVDYLLLKGANASIVNSSGMTAFDVAIISRKNNSSKLLQVLISNIAKISKCTSAKKISSAKLGDDLFHKRERSSSTPSIFDLATNTSFGNSKIKSLSSSTLNLVKSSIDLQLKITDCASNAQHSSSSENVKKCNLSEKGLFCNEVITHDCVSQLTFPGKERISNNALTPTIIHPDYSWMDRKDDVEVGVVIRNAIEKKRAARSLKPVKVLDPPKSVVPQNIVIPEINLCKENKVNNVLEQLSLEKYCNIFEEEAIDFSVLLDLSSSDLKELKIETLDRQELLNVIQQLKSLND